MAKPYKDGDVWKLRYKDASGRWRDKRSKCRTKAEAYALLRDIETQVERQRAGLDPLPSSNGLKTFKDLVEWYWIDYGFKLKGVSARGLVDKHILPGLGHLTIGEVTTDRIEASLASKERNGEIGPETVNKVRGTIHRIFNVAIKRGRWTGMNPAIAVERRKVPKRLPSSLTDTEASRLLAALDPRWRPLFATALFTGMRKGELLGLKKSSVDLESRCLRVANSYDADTTKGGHEDSLPIVEALVPYLRSAMDSSKSEYVFPGVDGRMQSKEVKLPMVLRRALGRAGIVSGWVHKCRRHHCGYKTESDTQECGCCPKCNMQLWAKAVPKHVRFHDLRHTTATLLLKNGVTLAIAQKILRHSDPRLTSGTYGHLNLDDMRAGLEKLNFGDGGRSLQEIAPPPSVAGATSATPELNGEEPVVATDVTQTPPRPRPLERLLFVREVAERLGVSTATVYKHCRLKKLAHVRISGAVRVDPVDLNRYIAEQKLMDEKPVAASS